MPKRKTPVLNNALARSILTELIEYARMKQFYPVQNALWRYMATPQFNPITKKQEPARYPGLGQWTYGYWFERLVLEGYIEIDQATRAIRCVHLEIVEKSDLPDL